MKWRKLGLIFSPEKVMTAGVLPDWMRSHAAVPIAEHLTGDMFRVYFSTRDANNRSSTASLVMDLSCPGKPVDLAEKPVLSPGELGGFDDSGAMATWLVDVGNTKLLYYIGWNLGVTVPFRNSVGVAREVAAGLYERLFTGPVLDRSPMEPHFCASCAVLRQASVWRIWYLACTGWRLVGGQPQHRYHIRYAESDDGILWRREGRVAIDFADDNEYAISRPSVLHDGQGWHMWYSYRGQRYRIGYATSDDGILWQRRDADAGIDVSAGGWDSDMIEYPFVFDHRGERYMLYNGNDYGRTGFGLAILEQ
jgi:hypothetical protein